MPNITFSCFHLNHTEACQCSPWCLTPSDCNWPADGSEDPDSDSNEAVSHSQAAVHSDHSWQHRVRKGPPNLFEHTQHQAAYLHCCWQPDTWKDTGSYHTAFHSSHLLLTVPSYWWFFWQMFSKTGDIVIQKRRRINDLCLSDFDRSLQIHCRWKGC